MFWGTMNSKFRLGKCSCVLSQKQVHTEGIHTNKQKKSEKSRLKANIKPPVPPPAARVLTCYLGERADASDFLFIALLIQISIALGQLDLLA